MGTTTIPECQTVNVKRRAIELAVCKEAVRRLVRRKALLKLQGLRRIVIPMAEVQGYLEAGEGAIPPKHSQKVAQNEPGNNHRLLKYFAIKRMQANHQAI
jgi:hypothetical protein